MFRLSPTAVPFPISDRTSIHSRPEQADGKRFGDFEMDLIVDSHNHAILTIVEHSTNMLFMAKLAHGKKAEHLPVDSTAPLRPLPPRKQRAFSFAISKKNRTFARKISILCLPIKSFSQATAQQVAFTLGIMSVRSAAA